MVGFTRSKEARNTIVEKIHEYQMRSGNTPIICVMGNISVGKTHLVRFLSKKLNSRIEPEVYDTDSLEEYYKNPEDNALSIQLVFLKSRFDAWKNELLKREQGNVVRPIVLDRCLMDDPVFAKAQLDSNRMKTSEYIEYRKKYQEYIRDLNKLPDINQQVIYIYLKCDPDECFERKVNRDGTNDKHVTKDYLHVLHNCYEEFIDKEMKGKNLITLNWKNFGSEMEVVEKFKPILEKIK